MTSLSRRKHPTTARESCGRPTASSRRWVAAALAALGIGGFALAQTPTYTIQPAEKKAPVVYTIPKPGEKLVPIAAKSPYAASTPAAPPITYTIQPQPAAPVTYPVAPSAPPITYPVQPQAAPITYAVPQPLPVMQPIIYQAVPAPMPVPTPPAPVYVPIPLMPAPIRPTPEPTGIVVVQPVAPPLFVVQTVPPVDDKSKVTPPVEDKSKAGEAADTKLADYGIEINPPKLERLYRLDSEAALKKRMVEEIMKRPVTPDKSRETNIEFPKYNPLWDGAYEPRKAVGLVKQIEPNYVLYRRLFAEEQNGERFGWDLGPIQPLWSTGAALKDMALIPYTYATRPKQIFDTSAGKCYPGDPVPYLIPPPELSLTGMTWETAVIAGLFVVIP